MSDATTETLIPVAKYTLMIDVTTDQAQALLNQCRKENRTLHEVGASAIAHYLQHKDLVKFNTAQALAD